jgi:cell division protein FtsZ
MEVDEAANHIKELVDPDANIIWGSAFNNDLDGKIRVSVVATGIDVEEATQAAPLQAKVFTFPGARGEATVRTAPAPETVRDEAPAPAPTPEPVAEAAPPVVLTPPETIGDETVEEEPVSFIDEQVEAPGELTLDHRLDDDGQDEGDELLLGDPEPTAEGEPLTDAEESAPAAGRRSWLSPHEEIEQPAPAPAAREGGTLFERMSNIARGAAKAQVDEESPRLKPSRDPLDIPRFLNRQNNQ